MRRVPIEKAKGDRTPLGQFARGSKRPPNSGRPPGQANHTTRVLKEALVLAAEAIGRDGKGLRGLQGYLERIATKHPECFCTLLGRILPLQVDMPARPPSATMTLEQLEANLRERGLPGHRYRSVLNQPADPQTAPPDATKH